VNWFRDIFAACWPDVFEACWPVSQAASPRPGSIDGAVEVNDASEVNSACEVHGAVEDHGMRIRRGSSRGSAGSDRLPEKPQNPMFDMLERIRLQKKAVQDNFKGIVESAATRVQANAAPEAMFFLRKDVDDPAKPYRMEGVATKRRHVPDGVYIFVVPENAMTEVVCGVFDRHEHAGDIPRVAGHAGLAHQQRVLFAGHLHFEAGALHHWDNSSGHYQFPADNAGTYVFPPHIRLLLPPDLHLSRIAIW